MSRPFHHERCNYYTNGVASASPRTRRPPIHGIRDRFTSNAATFSLQTSRLLHPVRHHRSYTDVATVLSWTSLPLHTDVAIVLPGTSRALHHGRRERSTTDIATASPRTLRPLHYGHCDRSTTDIATAPLRTSLLLHHGRLLRSTTDVATA